MAPLANIRTVNVTNDKRAFCANIRIIIVCIESEWARTQCKYRCFCILSDVLAKQVACYCYKMLSKSRTIFLGLSVAAAYVTWGLLISLQPPFYPSEAEKKGATPSQVNTVLGYNECTKPYYLKTDSGNKNHTSILTNYCQYFSMDLYLESQIWQPSCRPPYLEHMGQEWAQNSCIT